MGEPTWGRPPERYTFWGAGKASQPHSRLAAAGVRSGCVGAAEKVFRSGGAAQPGGATWGAPPKRYSFWGAGNASQPHARLADAGVRSGCLGAAGKVFRSGGAAHPGGPHRGRPPRNGILFGALGRHPSHTPGRLTRKSARGASGRPEKYSVPAGRPNLGEPTWGQAKRVVAGPGCNNVDCHWARLRPQSLPGQTTMKGLPEGQA